MPPRYTLDKWPKTAYRSLLEALDGNGGAFKNQQEWADAAGISIRRLKRCIHDPAFSDAFEQYLRRKIYIKLPPIIDKSAEVASKDEGFKDRELLLKAAGLLVDRQQREVRGQAEVLVFNPLDVLRTIQQQQQQQTTPVIEGSSRLLGEGSESD